MLLLPRLRLWARRQASLIWLLALVYAVTPLAQALQPQAQWVDMPYCAGAVSATPAPQTDPGVRHEQAKPGGTPLASEAGLEHGPIPAHAHLLVLFTPNACPAGSGPQAALPADTAFLPVAQPCVACAAPRQDSPPPATLAHTRPLTRAPPEADAAA